ncbi:MAG: YceI family protein, partial [Chitinophagaceae bacterium]
MKTLTSWMCLLLLFYVPSVPAQIYTPKDNGSSVQFIIRNLGFNVEGTFTHLQGSIHFDTENLSAAGFTVTVDAATVKTGNNSRDSHLKKEEYFNVAKYPLILFSSEKIEKSTTAGSYVATGNF